MEIFEPEDLPAVFRAGEAQIRSAEAGPMTVTSYRLPAGADGRPFLQGLPGKSCHCPHGGYVISGKLRIHTPGGQHDVLASQGFYVEPATPPRQLKTARCSRSHPRSNPASSWPISRS